MTQSAFGAAVDVGLNLIGGALNRQETKRANEQNAQIARENIKMQTEFAQQGIRWKVADAIQAGIHPLYALGANTTSFSPVSVGAQADSSLGNAMAAAGQDLSRAINTGRTQDERNSAFSKTVEQLTLQKMGLENDLLASQIAKLRQTSNPPMPALTPEGKAPQLATEYEDAPRLTAGRGLFNIDRTVANTEDFTKRYGEGADWIAGPYVAWRDYNANTGGIRQHWRGFAMDQLEKLGYRPRATFKDRWYGR